MIVQLIFLVLIFGVSATLLFEQAEGLVEFKKYKVINSPKVCGDKMCSEIDEERAKKGLSSHNIKICGDKPCYEITSKQANHKNKSSPHGQFFLGVALDLIECKKGQEMMIKKTNQFPACVDAKSVEKLREKGWAVSEKEQKEFFKEISNDRINKFSTQGNFDVLLSVIPEEINNQRYLMFDGYGWHRLHNVEITISAETFEESVRTKTDNRGHLNMPWPIPDSIGGKYYNIFATDGIHEFEMNIPITPKNSD